MPIPLPYIKVSRGLGNFTGSQLNDVLFECLETSRGKPCYIVASDDESQHVLFLRERQIYAAGRISNQQYINTNIHDFLNACSNMQNPKLICFESNAKILPSLLILFQKKPTMRFLSSLVDLDELLDKIEAEGKSCIVSATLNDFLAILRYEKGKASAMCHQVSQPYPREASFREDFLVKIYTLSTEKQVEICVYEDLLVSYAEDAKTISESFEGSIVDLFLAKPPKRKLEKRFFGW